jgi:hypothetical protein
MTEFEVIVFFNLDIRFDRDTLSNCYSDILKHCSSEAIDDDMDSDEDGKLLFCLLF